MQIDLKALIQEVSRPAFINEKDGRAVLAREPAGAQAFMPAIIPADLGDTGFKERHGLTYAYVAGAMANGICSEALVKTMAENGMIGFFGAGGLSLDRIEKAILTLKQDLGDLPFGFNLIHNIQEPALEMATVTLYLKHGIQRISAAAFMRMTQALVYYRVKGIHRDERGAVVAPNQVIAKVSRIEVARQFFSPPPEKLVSQLVEKGLLTPQEAALSQEIPMAQDLTAEADSGGHTDNRPALALLPTMIALKNEYMEKYRFPDPLCVGLAGGIATPESASAAFSMGAGYILTGSINQSCVEAGICQGVRQLLCQAEQADVAMAPAADMFEIGARVQVLKRGTLFAVRAEKLRQLYKTYDGFDQIPQNTQKEVEEKILLSSFESAWQSTRRFFLDRSNDGEVRKAQKDPRHKMALVFRSYLGQSSRWAIQGTPDRRMDYQIWCGPAIGAFNQWVRGSFMASHENRRAAEVALNLLMGACVCARAAFLRYQGIALPRDAAEFAPMTKEAVLARIQGADPM